MRGVVQLVNPRTGTFAVATEDGFTVVEVVDTIEVEVGDEIAGALDQHGSAPLLHIPSAEKFDAFVQAVGASEEGARALLT